MSVPHRTEAGRAEREVPACPRFEPKPAGSEHPENVPARKEQDVPPDLAHPTYHPVSPRSDLFGRLATRTAVAEQLPARALGVDFGAGATLVRAVVPFEEVRLDFGDGTEARH